MKVVIDEQKCQGHGRCYSLEPALFEPKDDLGHSAVVNDGVVDCGGLDGPDILARLTRAADACPERAITIHTTGDPQ